MLTFQARSPHRLVSGFRRHRATWLLLVALLVTAAAGAAPAEAQKLPAAAAPAPSAPPPSAPPPSANPTTQRFVAIGANEVHLRTGPGTQHPIEWIYTRRGMPMEVLAKVDNWLKLKDWRETEGWVLQTLVTETRYVIVVGGPGQERLLYDRPTERSEVKARVQPEVIARLLGCQATWCEVSVQDYRGWMERAQLWGVAEGEGVR